MSDGNIGAGPFAQPQYTDRERMPSQGGWNYNSLPQGYQQSARYSVAIAPDQLPDQAPTIATEPRPEAVDAQQSSLLGQTSEPFWVDMATRAQQYDMVLPQDDTPLPSQAIVGFQYVQTKCSEHQKQD